MIAHEIQRLDRVVQGFLRFVRPQDLRLAPVDVNAVLSDVARVARPEAARAGVEIVLEPGRGLPRVTADSGLIAQASANLVSNAIQAMPGGGTLVVASRRAAPDGVEIRVADQGDGHRAREPREDLPPLLHDEGGRIGHRPRDGVPHRADARRPGRRGVDGGQGHHRDAHAPRGPGRAMRILRARGRDPGPVRMPGARPECPAVGAARTRSARSRGAGSARGRGQHHARAAARPGARRSLAARRAAASGRLAGPRRAGSRRCRPRAASPPPASPASPPVQRRPPPAAPPAAPSPPLTASLPPAEARRLQDEAQRGIEETERLLRQLDGRPLAPKDLETLRLAQGLVEQARKALGGQEYERAANLAAKARTLADDLSTRR